MGVYMQVYNVAIDQATLRPAVDVEYVLSTGGKEALQEAEDWSGISDSGQRLTLARLVSRQLEPSPRRLRSTRYACATRSRASRSRPRRSSRSQRTSNALTRANKKGGALRVRRAAFDLTAALCFVDDCRRLHKNSDSRTRGQAQMRQRRARFVVLLFLLLTLPQTLIAQTLEERLKEVDEYAAQGRAGNGRCPGWLVAIVRDDKVSFAKGYGVRELGEPTRGATRSSRSPQVQGFHRGGAGDLSTRQDNWDDPVTISAIGSIYDPYASAK